MGKTLFGDVIEFVTERAPLTAATLDTYISTECMLPDFGGVTPASTLPTSGSVTQFKPTDTLFSNIRTYFRKVWFANRDGFCSPDVLVFRSKDKGVIFPNYIFHLARWSRFTEYTVATSKGAKMPRGDKDAIAKFDFLLPQLTEQRAIAAVLSALDDKIELNRRMNQTLERQARALFADWFTHFGPTRAKMAGKPPYLAPEIWSIFPDRLDKNGVPEEWEMIKAGTILNRLRCRRRFKKKDVKLNGSIPIFEQGTDILLGFHDGEAEFNASLDNPMFIFGDHTCVTKLSCRPFSISQNVIPLEGKTHQSVWTYYAIRGLQTFQEYKRHWSDLTEKSLAEPSLSLSTKFSELVSPLVHRMEENELESRTLAQTRDLLLPRLMSGELRVREAEIHLEDCV